MATAEELFAQIQSYEAPTIPADKAAEFAAARQAVQEAQSNVDLYGRLGTGLSFAGQGLTLGLADEALAGLSGLFGGPSYSESLAAQQAQREQMRTEYPTTALVSELAGGVAGALPAAAISAPGLGSRLLLGATGKAAPTVAQLAAIGATQGGIYGAASAEPGERLAGGLMGGGIGGVAGPVVGKAVQYGTEALGGVLGRAGTTLGSERGAISFGGPKYTPAEVQLAKVLSQTAPENLRGAEEAFIRAGQYGKPVFLPEAVESPALYQQAKLIANYPASTEIAKTAIEERAADAVNRIALTLDVVSPDRNVTSGANKLVEGAKSLLDELGVARKKATQGLYEAAFEKTPQLTAADAVELVQTNPRIQQAIKAVKKELPELVDQPDTSIEVLHQAQQYLNGKARAVKNKFTAGKIKDARTELMAAIKAESPDYAKATDTFAKMSKGLTAKEESKIGFLANVSPDKPGTIGRVFALDADVIASLRDDFKQDGKLAEWESGVRSYLQRALEQAQDNRNPINKIIGSPGLRDKLKAALGDKYDAIIEPLTIEQNILKGQREYFAGSPTEPLRQTGESLKESIGAIKSAVSAAKDPIGAAGKFLSKALGSEQDEKFYRDYAKLLFSAPEQGLETLGNVSKLADALRAARVAGEQAGGIGGAAAGREAAAGLDIVGESGKVRRQEMLGMAGAGTAAAVVAPELEDLFNQIQSYEPAAPTPQPEAVSRSKEKGKGIPTKEVSALLDEVPREYGINPRWVKAIAQVESSFNPKAVGPKTRFGQAQGLMQLMPATARALKVENPFDPKQAIEGASKLLVELDNAYGKYKDKRLLFAAYNSRPSTVKAAISQAKAAGKDITWENIAEYMPIETQNYVKKVTKLIEA
jgi:soluble lytic murein transglycosylase-like protein